MSTELVERSNELITKRIQNIPYYIAKKWRVEPTAYDDAISEGLIAIVRAARDYNSEIAEKTGCKFSTFAFKYASHAMSNTVQTIRKRLSREKSTSFSDSTDSHGEANGMPEPQAPNEKEDNSEAYKKLLAMAKLILSPLQFAVLHAATIQGMTFVEISKLCKRTPQRIRVVYHEAVEALKENTAVVAIAETM